MVDEICKEYVETNIGIDELSRKHHIGKLKVKKILTENGITIKKRGNQTTKEKFAVSDWGIDKYPPVDGMEYIVSDSKTGFKTKDVRNEGGHISGYLKKAYGLVFPTLYDRRKYYMKTGNYWWEQWLSVELVPTGTVSVERKEWEYIGPVSDEIGSIVTNRIRDAKPKDKPAKRTAKVNRAENGVRKSKNEIFIEKARIAHEGEKLDYNKVEYVDKSTPVYIIDHDLRPDGTEYGGYWQRPENHLRGSGHPDKSKDRNSEKFRYKWDELVEMFKAAHPGENIEYPEQDGYRNMNNRIRFIDHDLRPDGTEYGEVWQTAEAHLKGRMHPRKFHDSRIGVPDKNRKTNERFIEECNEKHSGFYTYEKTEYAGRRKKVVVTCPIHGDFETLAENHLAGHGCPKCGNVHRYTTDEFKEKVRGIHGNKYDLENIEYVNSKTKVKLTCHKHGEFEISPNKLLAGEGCYECGREKLYDSLRLTRDEVVEKANIVHNSRYTYDNFTEYKNNTSIMTVTCPIHGDFKQVVASHLAGCGCPKCFSTRSKAEEEIYEFVKSLGFSPIQGDRKMLDGLEIDVYVPEKKIGIEFNGLYWHSEENGKGKYYHVGKTNKAEEKGIKLIQVFEDEWVLHKDLVLSKIKHILGKDRDTTKVMARKCSVREITQEESAAFLDLWHIQGSSKSTVHYGAFYSGELIGAMSFKLYPDENMWELTRFATNGNYIASGIGGKLFKHFLREKKPSQVKSFADRRWTLDKSNNLYTKLGFTLESVERPDYRYVVGNERKHKFGFRKERLYRKYALPMTMTEKEMCTALGFYRIWDCGLLKYVYENKEIID